MSSFRIIVVDDESSITRMLKLVLERSLSAVVFPFSDARQALAWIDSGEAKPDLIACDLRMPGMDGISFCRALKERDSRVPIVILSAYASTEMGEETQELGVRAFVQKPFIPKLFVETVRGFLPETSPAPG